MTLSPSTIQPAVGAKQNSKRLGRGNGSGKGSYSSRGGKGQTARSGGGSRTQIRAFKAQLLKVPKLRGFKSFYAKEQSVTLKTLDRVFASGSIVTPKILKEKGVVKSSKNPVKVVAAGELKNKLKIEGCLASKKAIELVEKAGGSIKF